MKRSVLKAVSTKRMTIHGFATIATIALTIVGACTDTDRAPIEIDVSPERETAFARDVQAYVGVGCGSLDCHGDGSRALRLYAKFGLRYIDELRTLEVADEETRANVRAFAALTGPTGREHLAVLKALAESAGGMAHVGGDIWADTSDPGYLCVLAFVSGQADSSACADAFAAIDPEIE